MQVKESSSKALTLRPSYWASVYYPEEYKKMIKLASDTERMRESDLGRPFSVWQSNPKYNTEYRDKCIREKYLPKLIEQISRERGIVYDSNNQQ